MAYQVFESTVFNRVLGVEARMLFVPAEIAAELEALEEFPNGVLGVQLGVPIPESKGLVDVLYASLQGRVYTFDSDSFGRWRPRWEGQQSEQSLFAQELVFGKRTPVATSPLRLDSLANLVDRGQAYVADGVTWAAHHPLDALGIVVVVQGAILIVAVSRAVRDTIVVATKYHLRRAFGVPPDWMPPGDD